MNTASWVATLVIAIIASALIALLLGPHVAWKAGDILGVGTVFAAMVQAAFAAFALAGLRHARAQADAARQTAESVRAQIGLTRVELDNLQIGSPVKVKMHFQNFGQTSALGLAMTTAVALHRKGEVPVFNIEDPAGDVSVAVASPGHTFSGRAQNNLPLTQGLIDGLRNGDWEIHVAGRCVYTTLATSRETGFSLTTAATELNDLGVFWARSEGNYLT